MASHAMRKYGVANYSLKPRMVFVGDELYIIRSNPSDDNDELATRLSRPTYSYSAKFSPRRPPSSPVHERKPVVPNNNPVFKSVSRQEADSISHRLTRPTHSSRIRTSETNDEQNASRNPKSRESVSMWFTREQLNCRRLRDSTSPNSNDRSSASSRPNHSRPARRANPGTSTSTQDRGSISPDQKQVRFQSATTYRSLKSRPMSSDSDCIRMWFSMKKR